MPEPVPIRQKYYLPDESGYWEHSWYDRGPRLFSTARAGDALVGVQICTEMWFLEWSRHYAAERVEALLIPRATPRSTTAKWIASGQTAAVCSGAYCLSSNLSMPPGSSTAECGGVGWIIDPEGSVLATTSEESPFATLDIDLELARKSKRTYPRYVAE
jgi:N-carbamoylputrescine amidase